MLLAGAWHAAPAQQADTTWDVTRPRGQTRTIDFTVSEGTWMSLDVSPDGQWLVFDLLGQIYRLPIAGGTAVPLTEDSGIAVNFHPRISPDGRRVAFISDRQGQNNVWVMDADGKNPKAVLPDPGSTHRSPVWMPDGRFVLFEKINSLLFRSIHMVHVDGGKGTEIVKAEMGSMPSRPSASPDGKSVYYEIHTGRFSGTFGLDDILKGAYQLRRTDLATGDAIDITAGQSAQQDRGTSGGAYAPEVSPDGRWLAFLRRIPDGTITWKGHTYGPRSSLWLRDLQGGGERLLMDPVDPDMSEDGIQQHGTYPRYRWMPDGRSIVLAQGGKIRRVDVATGQVTTIPFTARVRRTISEQAWPRFRLSDGPVEARFLRWYAASPAGGTLAFQAFGRIWLKDLPDGTPRRLTPAGFGPFEFAPAWSPDGRSIAFTTWDDSTRGGIWRIAVGGGAPQPVPQPPGEYLNPVWTPDGRELVLIRGGGVTARGVGLARSPYWEIVRVPLDQGEATVLARLQSGQGFADLVRPAFGPDGRVFYTELKTKPTADPFQPVIAGTLTSVRLDGSDKTIHAEVSFADQVIPSPDGKWIAFSQAGNVFVAPFVLNATAGKPLTLDKNGGTMPVTRLSREGGLYPRWRSDGVLDFGNGPSFYTHHLSSGRTDTVSVRLTQPRAIARGTIALTGARIITLENRQVIPSGTVLVRDGRIACVGTCDAAGADRTVDLSGKTIIPGWVDTHAHHHRENAGVLPSRNFETAIYLAYGVTTTLDPAAWSPETFASAELVEAGGMVGPRIFATGENITSGDNTGTNDITSLEVALAEAARRKSWGAISLKQYLQPRRTQRQWVAEAGRRLGLRVTAEGSIDLPHKLSMAMDGHTGFEHATALVPLYADVTNFLGKTRSVYAATPLVGGPGPWNEEFFWQDSEVWKDAKAQRWLPWRQLIPHTRRYIRRPVTDYPRGLLSQGVADIIAAGGYGSIGSHGQQHGIGSHWDVWLYAEAMEPIAALEVASLHGAIFLGLEQDLGSLRAGKLADLVVLNGNPLEDIRKTADLAYVMKAGVLYDANSLDEIWPRTRPFGNTPWYIPEMYRADNRPLDIWDRR
jgi:Tol biopolymer transport system component